MADLENEAAWITSEKSRPLQVRAGPIPDPSSHEVVIKVAYAAVNPTDFKMQDMAYLPVPYPFILGTDVAGTIVQVGSAVSKLKLGQRVIGHCDSLVTQKATNAGFQLYNTCRERLTSAVPDGVPLAEAVVLPLGADTAATALFQMLQLPLPTVRPKPIGRAILIWGGASSCGSCAIQLAVAAGLRVITTASEANFDYVKQLGAVIVFDYHDSGTIESIKKLLKSGDLVADFVSTPEAQRACADILASIGGGLLPIVLWPQVEYPEAVHPRIVMSLAPGFTTEELGDPWGTASLGAAELGEAIWHDFVPVALQSGQLKTKPDPLIIKGGLSKVQEGIDVMRKGVSARKIVIEIAGEP